MDLMPAHSLRSRVRDFIDRVRTSPADATDPRVLARLAAAAEASWDGAFVAEHAPNAPLTWEVFAYFDRGSLVTERVNFSFPGPVEIVGMRPTVVALDAAGSAALTTDDLLCTIDIDKQANATSGEGIRTSSGTKAGAEVTLSSLGVQSPRLLGLRLEHAKPDVGFTFRKKRETANHFHGSLVGVSLFVRELRR